MTRILITGGAGFIGSHLADELLSRGCTVRVLDALIPQVHGNDGMRPAYLAADIELVTGDVRDRDIVKRALDGIDVVYHLAARVGVAQSMAELEEYTSINNLGTAVLLEALMERPVKRLIVASSMSVYGEGLYRDATDRVHTDVARTPEQLARGDWEPTADGLALTTIPTPEWKPPSVASVYAVSKYHQERMCLMVGSAYRIPTVALRMFNVYGPRMVLSNPYAGVLAVFAARYLHGHAPHVFEDGRQRRDFVHVRDVVAACRLALDVDRAAGGVFNIGSGHAHTIGDVAERLARVLGKRITPHLSGHARTGDVRHCTADITHARRVLGYRPEIELDQGLAQLAEWLSASSLGVVR